MIVTGRTVRRHSGEPHDPSLADNFEKTVGLARFAERHGALFGRIQLIRKQSSAGGECFARLEINQAAAIKKLLLITSNPQLDELFANLIGVESVGQCDGCNRYAGLIARLHDCGLELGAVPTLATARRQLDRISVHLSTTDEVDMRLPS